MIFHSPTKGQRTLEQVAEDIIEFINLEPNRNYRLVFGTDSEGKADAEIVTAIVIHRLGSGGKYFWLRKPKTHFHTLRERIYAEVESSIKIFQNFYEIFQEKTLLAQIDPNIIKIEIHVDIGENGETATMLKEITGMVKAYNLNVKTKPNAYAASCVADTHT